MKKNKKIFSTANLFFICVFGTFIFEYFHSTFENVVSSKPNIAFVLLILEIIVIPVWFYSNFPIFVSKKVEQLDSNFYENIYFKKINILSCLFVGFFKFVKVSNLISLFSGSTLKLGVKGRECKFVYSSDIVKWYHRIYDVILTIICSIGAFWVAKSFAKFGIVFGIILSSYAILYLNKKIILNHIFSVIIEKNKSYELRVIYPYDIFDGIFYNNYAFAYYLSNIIFLSKDVFGGGNILKKYVLEHEIGHLKTANRNKNFFFLFSFIFITFLAICASGVLNEIGIKNIAIILMPSFLYFIFLIFYIPLLRKNNQKNEFKADAYAIKSIGKKAVLSGIEIIKENNLDKNLKTKFSDIPIDRRIEFVRAYQQEQ